MIQRLYTNAYINIHVLRKGNTGPPRQYTHRTADQNKQSYTRQAFRWRDWIAGLIRAIIIHHMIHTNPPVQPSLYWAQLLVRRCVPPVTGSCTAMTWPVWSWTSLNVEIFVVGIERSPRPINFLQAAACRPVVGIPNCGVNTHWLCVGVSYPFCLVVFVNPNWESINKKPREKQN